jgi:hypothetical protein
MNPRIDVCISRIKIYQKLYHEIKSVMQRQMLEDISTIIWTMRTRTSQFKALILGYDSLSEVECSSRLYDIRMEINIQTRRVMDGRYLSFVGFVKI